MTKNIIYEDENIIITDRLIKSGNKDYDLIGIKEVKICSKWSVWLYKLLLKRRNAFKRNREKINSLIKEINTQKAEILFKKNFSEEEVAKKFKNMGLSYAEREVIYDAIKRKNLIKFLFQNASKTLLAWLSIFLMGTINNYFAIIPKGILGIIAAAVAIYSIFPILKVKYSIPAGKYKCYYFIEIIGRKEKEIILVSQDKIYIENVCKRIKERLRDLRGL